MKISLFVMLIFGGNVFCQDPQLPFTFTVLDLLETASTYTTCDDNGKPMELISALRIDINGRTCLDNGLPVFLQLEKVKEFKKPTWYRWEPAAKNWKKQEVPQGYNSMEGKPEFNVIIKCPGIYAFFEPIPVVQYKIEFKSPKKMNVVKYKITQEAPFICLEIKPKKDGEFPKIPLRTLKFDALITITYLEKGKEKSIDMLAGALYDFTQSAEDIIKTLQYKPGKTQTLFTSNINQ